VIDITRTPEAWQPSRAGGSARDPRRTGVPGDPGRDL